MGSRFSFVRQARHLRRSLARRMLVAATMTAIALSVFGFVIADAPSAHAANSDIFFYDLNGDPVTAFYGSEPFGAAFPNPEPCPTVPDVGPVPFPTSAYTNVSVVVPAGFPGVAGGSVDHDTGAWSVPVPSAGRRSIFGS
jgi:hypothetical protein